MSHHRRRPNLVCAAAASFAALLCVRRPASFSLRPRFHLCRGLSPQSHSSRDWVEDHRPSMRGVGFRQSRGRGEEIQNNIPFEGDAAAAVAFCETSTSAVVLTVWPSGTGELDEVRRWLQCRNASIVHEQRVHLRSDLSEVLAVLALYEGEDWLESNCWYHEQPLPDGPPPGPYAGAKWKRALCFRNRESNDLHVFVLDVRSVTDSLWSDKYSVRAALARSSGNPGNSCIHLTDEQTEAVLEQGGGFSEGGLACDTSFAFSCARALLHQASSEWLNGDVVSALGLGSPGFRASWRKYCAWLVSREPSVAVSADGIFEWISPASNFKFADQDAP